MLGVGVQKELHWQRRASCHVYTAGMTRRGGGHSYKLMREVVANMTGKQLSVVMIGWL